jgi:hypothetical protein
MLLGPNVPWQCDTKMELLDLGASMHNLRVVIYYIETMALKLKHLGL